MDFKANKPASPATAATAATAGKTRVTPVVRRVVTPAPAPAPQGWLRRMLARVPSLLPSTCVLCGQDDEQSLCQPCRRRFFTRAHRRCVQCALPMPVTGKELRCGACLKSRPAFDATIVAADYIGPSDQLIHALKFSGELRIAPLLAELLHQAALRSPVPGSDVQLALPALLAPVPLGGSRLQERGFNQSLEIARPLARRLDVKLYPQLLQRVRDTQAQSGLPLLQRARNVRRAFAVPYDMVDHVRGRHVGVVDDVMTTGETLGEIAATLKRLGAKRVTNLVFARTLPT